MSRLLLHAAGILSLIFLLVNLAACGRFAPPPSCAELFRPGERPGYELMPNGLARHNSSDTTWYRCPGGTAYAASRCQGNPLYTSWEEATAYAQEFSQQTGIDWRLPSNDELEDITESDCNAPTLNPQVFGALDIENYWTSTKTLYNDMFRCVYYTQNGSVYCRELRTLEHPFLLIRAD
jgi:hypothetical protein